MWTAEQRARHIVRMTRERKGYPTDVNDQEWKLIEPLLPGAARTGRPCRTELRQVINALRYLVRSGCEWRMLPNDFLPIKRCTTGSPSCTTFPVANDSRSGIDAGPDV